MKQRFILRTRIKKGTGVDVDVEKPTICMIGPQREALSLRHIILAAVI